MQENSQAGLSDADTQVLIQLVRLLTQEIDNLLDSCIEDGKLKTPDRKAVVKARTLLPRGYKHSFIKD